MADPTHNGHRSRLKRRFEKEGLDHFEPHEVLELLLYHALPQGDVNPLAHQLIDRFGSLDGVLRASPEELRQVSGVGKRTTDVLCFLPIILDIYRAQRLKDRPNLGTLVDASKYCTKVFMDIPDEQVWVFNMNMTGYLLHSTMLSSRSLISMDHITQQIIELSIRYRAQCFLLAHRRLPHNMSVAPRDIKVAQYLYTTFLKLDIPIIDHLLICGHRIHSFRESGFIYPNPAQMLNESKPYDSVPFPNWLDGWKEKI